MDLQPGKRGNQLVARQPLAHQILAPHGDTGVIHGGEMFQLSYTGFLEVLSAEERYLDSELEHIEISSPPIYAGRRYCCTGRWEAVVDFYRDAIVIVLQPALQCYCTPVAVALHA